MREALRHNPLVGVHVRLSVLEPSHYASLRDIEYSDPRADLGRFRNSTPSPGVYSAWIWKNVLSQYVIVHRRTDDLVGLVSAYEFRRVSGTVKVSILTDSRYHQSGYGVAGLALFIDLIFASWPIRTIYFDVLEPNWRQFGHFVDWIGAVELVLSEHDYVQGRYESLIVASVGRENWEEHAAPIVAEQIRIASQIQSAPEQMTH